jgi:hypothetical protein
MHLVLSVGKQILAISPIDPGRLYDTDYLQARKRLLKIIHRFSIMAKGEPMFYLSIQSKMNNA